jgi:hypothetical protein
MFFPSVPVSANGVNRSRSPLAHLSGAAAAFRLAPHTSDRVQAAQQRGLVRDEKTNWVDLDG